MNIIPVAQALKMDNYKQELEQTIRTGPVNALAMLSNKHRRSRSDCTPIKLDILAPKKSRSFTAEDTSGYKIPNLKNQETKLIAPPPGFDQLKTDTNPKAMELLTQASNIKERESRKGAIPKTTSLLSPPTPDVKDDLRDRSPIKKSDSEEFTEHATRLFSRLTLGTSHADRPDTTYASLDKPKDQASNFSATTSLKESMDPLLPQIGDNAHTNAMKLSSLAMTSLARSDETTLMETDGITSNNETSLVATGTQRIITPQPTLKIISENTQTLKSNSDLMNIKAHLHTPIQDEEFLDQSMLMQSKIIEAAFLDLEHENEQMREQIDEILDEKEKYQHEVEEAMNKLNNSKAEETTRLQAELDTLEEEISELKSANQEQAKLMAEINETKDALHQCNIDKENMQERFRDVTSRLYEANKQVETLQTELKDTKEKHSQAMVLHQKALSDAQLADKLKLQSNFRMAQIIHNNPAMASRATSVLNLAKDRTILMMGQEGVSSSDEEEEEVTAKVEQLSREQAEKAIRNIEWPNLNDNGPTYRRIFAMQITNAQQKGIPDSTIKDSIFAHLMKDPKTVNEFVNLTQQIQPKDLGAMVKIIKKLDPRENFLSLEERFKLMTRKQHETPISFFTRVETTYKDMFSKKIPGAKRRIMDQFIDGYSEMGIRFSKEDKRAFKSFDDPIRLVMTAEEIMNEKVDKARSQPAKQINMVTQQQMPLQQQIPIHQPMAIHPQIPIQQQMPSFAPGPSFGPYLGNQPQHYAGSINMVTNQPRIIRSSAGPNAIRVSRREYEARRSDSGMPFCPKCLQTTHSDTKLCTFYPFCVICFETTGHGEVRHSTRFHDLAISKQGSLPTANQGNQFRQTNSGNQFQQANPSNQFQSFNQTNGFQQPSIPAAQYPATAALPQQNAQNAINNAQVMQNGQ